MLLATEWNASKRQPFRLLIVTISYKHTISYKQTKSKKLRPERSLYRVTTIPSTINVILTMRQKRAYLFTTIGPFLTVATLRTEIFSSGSGSSFLCRRRRQPANMCPFSMMKKAAPMRKTSPIINQKLATLTSDVKGTATSPMTRMAAKVVKAHLFCLSFDNLCSSVLWLNGKSVAQGRAWNKAFRLEDKYAFGSLGSTILDLLRA